MYAMLLPGLLFVLLFAYTPMYGLVIGFKKYNIFAGANPFDAIAHSPWVGLDNWNALWRQTFRQAVTNTFVISPQVAFCFRWALFSRHDQ